jgi:multicomponent Na+:H+ antiporter subunit D
MSDQLPAIIVVLPLVMSFFIFFSGWWIQRAGFALAVGALMCCVLLSAGIMNVVINKGAIHYWLGGWEPPWGIEYYADYLSTFMLVLVSTLGMLVAVYSKKLVERELQRKTALFWSLFILFITGLLGICVTGDLFNLFVMLEVASLTGYALIAIGEKRALYASFRYLVVGTMGASFFLLGVGYLYIATGSLNMADLSQLLPQLYHSKTILAGFVFIFTGLSIKLALFPLHGWLPDAYTYAPSAVSAAVAPLMTKVMAYVIIRIMFTVFKPDYLVAVIRATDLMVWFGTAAILFGAVLALSQHDYKRMLSYVIVAEIGYIVGGIGLANATALKGAVFHILNDAVMVACLFLVAGLVVYRTGGHRISDFKGIFRSMPFTAAIFAVGALAVIGVPPTCGFFSKWYLLLGGIEAGHWGFVVALLASTLINVALFFRIIDRGLYIHAQKFVTAGNGPADNPHSIEAPLSMLLPACVLALAILLIGIFNQAIVNRIIQFAIPAGL